MRKEDIAHEEYLHVDNGGIWVRVDTIGNIELEFGFFGYSTTTIELSNMLKNGEDLSSALIRILQEAKFLIPLKN